MKPRLVLGVFVLAISTAALASTTNVTHSEKLKADQFCEISSSDAATEASASTASADLADVKGWAKIDPTQPTVNDGSNCPNENTCSCGVPTINPDDPACIPGVDLGLTHCRSLHCPEGQTVHLRTCPCTATGCSATWSALFCAAP